MWRCLLGRPMIPTSDLKQCVNIAKDKAPFRIPNHELPAPLITIIEKAVEKDASNRYQNASEMLAALQAYIKEESPMDHDQNINNDYMDENDDKDLFSENENSPFQRSSSNIVDPNLLASADNNFFAPSSPSRVSSSSKTKSPPPFKPHEE